MTNSIKELDFAAAKEQLKDFLRQQEQFKDYDFDGSNMSVLLDVLAYNTYQNAFYGNMLTSEMFLDSAQIRNSVISHAKELNYLPRSVKAPKAIVTVNLYIANSSASEFTIPTGTKFYSSANNGTTPSVFSTRQAYVAHRVPGTQRFEAKCIDIYQGIIYSEVLRMDTTGTVRVSNDSVDADTIQVLVGENDADYEYMRRDAISGVGSQDRVFYVEADYDGLYRILFGGDKYGKQPLRNHNITLTYSVSDGEAMNGASSFTTTEIPGAVITTISPAAGGSARESLAEIKFNAPKSIQTQERAVTASDYKSLLIQRFTQIAAISVYGGDELSPPRHGKIAISVNLKGNVLASDSFKSEVINFLSDKVPVSLRPIFVNPEFIYAAIDIDVSYDPTQTRRQEVDFTVDIKKSVLQHNNDTDFGYTLRQSVITRGIDAIDRAILGSSVSVKPVIEYSPVPQIVQNAVLDFRTALVKPYRLEMGRSLADYKPAVKSTNFVYDGTTAFMQDDGNGRLKVFSNDTRGTNIMLQDAGTVDYETGVVTITSMIFGGFEGSAIRYTANTRDNNISAPKNRILVIREDDVNVTYKRTK